jgi:hypothetical protein
VALDLLVVRREAPPTRDEERHLRERIAEALSLTFESLWTLVPDPPNGASDGSAANGPAPHKRLRLELEDVGGRWSLRAREFDEPTNSWSEWVTDRTSDETRLAICAAGLARRCFRPIALIDTFRGELRQVAVRGAMHWPGSLPPPEAAPLEIWLLYLNKSKEIEKRQRAPWSYLVHEAPPGDAAPAPPQGDAAPSQPAPPAPKWQVVSGVRGSLGTRSQRVLAVGLAVSVPVSGTRLVLRPWKSTVRRIPGVDLVLSDRAPVAPKAPVEAKGPVAPKTPDAAKNPEASKDDDAPHKTTAVTRLVSDRRGEVIIPARSDRPEIRQLEVLSGKQVLARLPILPGARAEDVLELPDDELRLRVEGDMAILQAGMIDIVSRRAVLMARARRDARFGLWPSVDASLKAIAELPTAATIAADLARIEGPALEQAKRDRDRVTQSRIKRLCSETRDTLNRFLSDDPVKLLREEIADLRTAVNESPVKESAAPVKAPAKPAATNTDPPKGAPAAPADANAPAPTTPAPTAPAAPKPATGL